MNALKKAAKAFALEIPRLEDFKVRIPPGGRTGALVETQVTWRREIGAQAKRKPRFETFTTMGVDSDQMASAVIATEKMLNAIAAPGGRPERARKPLKKKRKSSKR